MSVLPYDFSESRAAVGLVAGWWVHLEGKAKANARGVQIVSWAAVGAEIRACFAGVVSMGVWI